MLSWHSHDSQKEFICENKICNNCEIKFSMQLGVRSAICPLPDLFIQYDIILP